MVAVVVLCADDDVVDGDVNQLDEEPDEAHDGETDGSGDRDLLEFWKNKTIFHSIWCSINDVMQGV